VDSYIHHRWATAGGSAPAPFAPEALQAIVQWSGGIPRVINSICENALMLAFGDNASVVAMRHVREAGLDLDLVRPAEQTSLFTAPNGTTKVPLPSASPALANSGVPTLERYAAENSRPSLWSRLTGRRGSAQNGRGSI
jgi:hypothetical protein